MASAFGKSFGFAFGAAFGLVAPAAPVTDADTVTVQKQIITSPAFVSRMAEHPIVVQPIDSDVQHQKTQQHKQDEADIAMLLILICASVE